MNKKILRDITMFLIGGLIFGSIGTVFALTYRASDVTYTPIDNTWNVTTVGQAINDLALSKTSDNYSTEERVVGTWIDGKPLYQKTIIYEDVNGIGNGTVIGTLPITSEKDIVNMSGVSFQKNATAIYLPAVGNPYWYSGISLNSKGELYIESNVNYLTLIKVTIQYIKTTDTTTN